MRSRNVAWAWALGLGLVSAVLLILHARQRRHDAGSELMPHDAAEREQLLGQMLNAIHAHLATTSVPFLADLMDLNERQLYRLCAKHALRTGTLIREIRLDRAQFLIRKEDCSVPDAAKQVGFTVRHLAKLLKEQAEAPPGATPDAAPRA